MINLKKLKPTVPQNKELSDINTRKEKEFNLDRSLNKRFKLIIVVVVLLFSLVWVNLYSVQIIKNDSYTQKLQNFTKSYISEPSLRGNIYDRNGEVLVSNQERLSIVYYPPKDVTTEQEWAMALHFASHFAIDNRTLYPRDLKDMYIFLYPDLAKKKISDQEWIS